MRRHVTHLLVIALGAGGLLSCTTHQPVAPTKADATLAVLVPGSGSYSRPITTDSPAGPTILRPGASPVLGLLFSRIYCFSPGSGAPRSRSSHALLGHGPGDGAKSK